jgi:hypothetical protein
MVHSESYKGTQVSITTNSSESNAWTWRAEFALPGQDPVTLENAVVTYSSEQDAIAAALRATVEAIDRSRVSTGKW